MSITEERRNLKKELKKAQKIVFFTGAGVSTDSGIPDFRSQDGLYNQQYAYPPEEILSHRFFQTKTEEFYAFYRKKMLYLDVQPSIVHNFIKEYEQSGKDVSVITQNIDGLHQLAGSKRVYELHGSVLRNYCVNCHQFYPVEYIVNSKGIPLCTKCHHIVKPDVVLYGEALAEDVLWQSIEALKKADTCVVLGTSLAVYPAANLLNYFLGDTLILINREQIPYDKYANMVIHDEFKNIFKDIMI